MGGSPYLDHMTEKRSGSIAGCLFRWQWIRRFSTIGYNTEWAESPYNIRFKNS